MTTSLDPGEPVSRLVQDRLADQVAKLARHETAARVGDDEGVHRMRVTCRRLRSLLATARPVLDREVTDPIRAELRWIAGVLGDARDATVVHERLRGLVAEEPPELVLGPVPARLDATYAERGAPELRAALESSRFGDLRDRLERLVAAPPWTELADAPARDVLPRMLRKERRRVRKAVRSAEAADHSAAELHEVRKAAKRLRYAAETAAPVGGKPARRLAARSRRLTSRLGSLQDAEMSQTELLAVARAAAAAGEPTFTYGRLHRREEELAERLTATYRAAAADRHLKGAVRDVGAALGED